MSALKMANNERSEYQISEDTAKEVKQYIKINLKDKLGLSDNPHGKRLATVDDVKRLLDQLQKHDQHIYHNERTRIQVAFMLKVLVYTAARPGAVVVSDAHRNTNEALLYEVRFVWSTIHVTNNPQDCAVMLLRNIKDKDDRPLIALVIRFNIMKGRRDKPGEYYV